MVGLGSAVFTTLRERPVASPVSVTEEENGPRVGFYSAFQQEGLRVGHRPGSKTYQWDPQPSTLRAFSLGQGLGAAYDCGSCSS